MIKTFGLPRRSQHRRCDSEFSELSIGPLRSIRCSSARIHRNVRHQKLHGHHAFRSSFAQAHQPRTFKSFQDAAAEAAISRLYGGIHYSFDNNDGLESGECIGRTILDRVKFKR